MKEEVEPFYGALRSWSTVGSFCYFLRFPHKEQTMNFVGIDLHKTSVVEADRFVLEQLIAEFHSYVQAVGRG